MVQKNPGFGFFLKKPNPTHWVLGFCWVLGFIGFWSFLFERAVWKLIGDLAYQLSFYLDCQYFRLSKSLQIHCLLFIRICKHKEICNYYWYDKLKLN